MSIINLPEDLQLESSLSIQLYDYVNPKDSEKLQINLSKNTISFLQQGSKEVIHNNKTIAIQNSEFLIMKSGHCLMTEKLPSSKDNYSSILLFFSDDDLNNFKNKFEYLSENKLVKTSVLAIEYDHFIRKFVESLKEILLMNPMAQSRMVSLKFEELMLYISEIKGFDFLDSLDIDSNKYAISFKSIIESNKLNKLTLKELSFLCNMSLSTFKRVFQKHYQLSPIKWFQNERLEYAAFLLNKEKKKSSEIFDLVGYENHSNFIKAFKNKFGTTPKKLQ
jgi:AraC-like DNA-binding protein